MAVSIPYMSDMTESADHWERLGRYLAGESSPEESVAMRRWLEEHPDQARIVDAVDAAAARSARAAEPDVDAALARVRARPLQPAEKPRRPFAPFGRRVELIGIAASVLLVAGVFLFQRLDVLRLPAPEVAYHTGIGQRDSVRLEDGSTVLLGPASRVTVRDRDITLSGEAYFRVVHDGARPFTVRAGAAVIRDIGTEFSVQSDTGRNVRVVVQEGAVELSHVSDTVMLHPGDVGVVAQSGRVEASRGTATSDDLAWTRGQLVFRDAAVREVAADLRRWYGVQLRVTDSSLLARRYSGSFVNETPEAVLDVIALVLDVRVERRGDTAYLSPTRRR